MLGFKKIETPNDVYYNARVGAVYGAALGFVLVVVIEVSANWEKMS